MRRRLPSLTALRAFEAAARHASFTRAADELAVTQTAVSHQIRGLEEDLGLKLFLRDGRRMLLTDAGRELLLPVSDAFDRIDAIADRLRRVDRDAPLTVSVLPSFAAKWLVPRLGRFQAKHPEIDVRLAAEARLADFGRDGVDVAVRAGRGPWPGLTVEQFLTEEMFPVCSPRLLAGLVPLERPEDLVHHILLHDDFETGWRMWLEAAGATAVQWSRGPRFSDSSMVIQAAVEGQGVALARGALASLDLAAGRLVRPFSIDLPSDYAYHLVYPPAHAERAKVAAFRAWLFEEAAAR